MGQRHQTFVVVHNPYRTAKKQLSNASAEQKNSHKEHYAKKEKELKQMKAQFGTGEKTVLAFHHQWLYGATALAVARNFLEFSELKEEDKYSNPFHKESNIDGLELVNLVKFTLSIHRYIPGFTGRGTGYEKFHYLNAEESGMREDCTIGDNNDGITIIDTTTGKYCFMNIGYGDSSIMKAKPKTPLTAAEYLKCYYPESISDETEDEQVEIISASTEEKIKKQTAYANNKKLTIKAKKLFSKFKVLSLEELSGIFPKVFISKKEKEIEMV